MRIAGTLGLLLVAGVANAIGLTTPGERSEAAMAPSMPPGTPLVRCHAVDGDTLRCGTERIRLIGIDSPELPGHCRSGRACAAGDPVAAGKALRHAVGTAMTIRRFGQDHYGRTLALVAGPRGDLSCGQLRAGHAIYRPDWDEVGALRKRCDGAVVPEGT